MNTYEMTRALPLLQTRPWDSYRRLSSYSILSLLPYLDTLGTGTYIHIPCLYQATYLNVYKLQLSQVPSEVDCRAWFNGVVASNVGWVILYQLLVVYVLQVKIPLKS